MSFAWTDDRTRMASKLWLEGRSASQIAAELGSDVTRSAVIGRMHRLGLSSPRPAGRPKPAPAVRAPGGPAPVTGPVEEVAPAPAPIIAAPLPHLTITELRDGLCRWPLGDIQSRAIHFCGRRCDPTSSYCDEHHDLAVDPRSRRERAPIRSPFVPTSPAAGLPQSREIES